MLALPDRTEAAEYYLTYINQVPEGDVRTLLRDQADETIQLLNNISEDDSLRRYAPDKWSVREVVNHINDTERLFVYRAFWFARGFESPLPSFDQIVAANTAHADDRSWRSLIEEFRAVRDASITFFESLSEDAWTRRGIASDNPFTVRALAYITVGHVGHHVRILQEKYGVLVK